MILEEARESYAAEIVHELRSDTLEDMESNLARVAEWLRQWKAAKQDAAEDGDAADAS